jgi:hypothetical protein
VVRDYPRVAEIVGFHVDRSDTLTPGAVLQNQPLPAMPADVPALADEWPGGLTGHGLRYATSASFDGETASEWFFELVRRAEFSTMRSRFQAVFAMTSLSDARAFRHAMGGNLLVPIVRVQGALAHRANMNLIRWTAPAVATLARAREYWQGEQGVAAPLWEVLLQPPVTVLDRVDEREAA